MFVKYPFLRWIPQVDQIPILLQKPYVCRISFCWKTSSTVDQIFFYVKEIQFFAKENSRLSLHSVLTKSIISALHTSTRRQLLITKNNMESWPFGIQTEILRLRGAFATKITGAWSTSLSKLPRYRNFANLSEIIQLNKPIIFTRV